MAEDDIATFARESLDGRTGFIEVDAAPSGAFRDRVGSVLTIHVTGDDSTATLLVSLVPADTHIGDEDRPLVEMLASNAATALTRIDAPTRSNDIVQQEV